MAFASAPPVDTGSDAGGVDWGAWALIIWGPLALIGAIVLGRVIAERDRHDR